MAFTLHALRRGGSGHRTVATTETRIGTVDLQINIATGVPASIGPGNNFNNPILYEECSFNL